MRYRAAAVLALALQAGCGSSGGVDAGRSDAGDSAADTPRDTPAAGDAGLDAPGVDGADARDEVANVDVPADLPLDATDAPTGTDGPTGCGVIDGVWSVLPSGIWSRSYGTMWSTAPLTFLYQGDRGDLRRWNGSVSAALPAQPPPAPFHAGSVIRGSGENDVWLGGTGPWTRAGVTDRLYVDVTHWDGVSWKDLTLGIPVSPEIQNPTGLQAGQVGAFWPVAADEAWQWVKTSYISGAPATAPVPYHLEGGTWKAVSSPLDASNTLPVAMWGATKNDLWAGGSVSRQVPPVGDASAPTTAQDPLLLHWDGAVWTRVELPIANGNGLRGVTSIWGSATNDVWAVGRTDASADTWHFDGGRWTELPVAGPALFEQVWGTCAGDYWAVGRPELRPWHYDGRTWSPVPLPPGLTVYPSNYLGVPRVTGTGPGDVWVTVQTAETCTPYEQGPYPLAAHWGPNRCGDGVVAAGETCDPPRTSGDGLRCDSSCQRPRCGNGVMDSGEDCDPPNQGDGVQCDETCRRPTCGNGVVDASEECDPPRVGFCDRQCRNVAAVCGDSIKQTGEECDFPDPTPGPTPPLCWSNCTWDCWNHCQLDHPNTSHGRCGRQACASFSGLDAARCWSVLACLMGTRCVFDPFGPIVLDSLCFIGGTEPTPCAAPVRALLANVRPELDTSDLAVLQDEMINGHGLLNLIAFEAMSALRAPTTACSTIVCKTP